MPIALDALNARTKIAGIPICLIVIIIVSFGLFAMSGCTTSTAPTNVSIYGICDIDQKVWNQIEVPDERDKMLEMGSDLSIESIQSRFVTMDTSKEVWFEDLDGNTLGCRFKKMAICGGGVVKTVAFKRDGSSWTVGPVTNIICSHY